MMNCLDIKCFKEDLARLLEKYKVEIDFDYTDSYGGIFNQKIILWSVDGSIKSQILLDGLSITTEKLRNYKGK